MSIVMDKYDAMEEEQNLRYFSTVFAASQILGALSVILVAVWMGSYTGFGWSEDPEKQFSYHPLFMTIGLIFLYGEAILVYRVFRHERKEFTKTLHAVLHGTIFVFFVVALKAVFDSHNLHHGGPQANMYSLHSWVGLGTVLLFSFQLLCGFLFFLFPKFSLPARQWYMPIHQFFGMAIFILSTATALMGITERAAFHVYKGSLSPEATLVNFFGVTVALYAFSVIYLVANPRFKRRSLAEEESLQQLHTSD